MATSGDCPGSESQGREEPVEHCEQHLPEGVHPEEFVAIADYSATDETQLSFLRGEKILILRQTTADWWWGERAGYCGYIPANHLGKDLEEGDPEDTWQDEEPQLVLSTGPFHPTTHWKQVLFMMDEPVPVHAGDVLTGSIVLQRNPVWRRHMSVALSWSVTSRQDPTVQRVGEKVFPIWR
uniref:Protein arginine methyltransferase 2 n=1 Tax=Myotis myotis TaxID=51298 RepID=A0A7J8A1H1_MYOMY|nr:protein arginine methyltransferase 2 [Myotis myotis]